MVTAAGAGTGLPITCAHAAASGRKVFGWEGNAANRESICDGEMASADLQNQQIRLLSAHETTWDGQRCAPPRLPQSSRPRIAADLAASTPDKSDSGDHRRRRSVGSITLSAWVRGTGERSLRRNHSCRWTGSCGCSRRTQCCCYTYSGKTGLLTAKDVERRKVFGFVVACAIFADYSPWDNAQFRLHFEKSRGVHGDAHRAFGYHAITRTPDVDNSPRSKWRPWIAFVFAGA